MKQESGFTLVEIALVMLGIGLLIGGIFGGLALIDNQKVSSTIQMLKKIESSTNSFKLTYGALPGDLLNPAVIPNCAAAPCNLAGNNDGIIGPTGDAWTAAIGNTNEKFVYWQQLLAADLMDGYLATNSMEFGADAGGGQPVTPLDTGLRLGYNAGLQFAFYFMDYFPHVGIFTNSTNGVIAFDALSAVTDAKITSKIDQKMDDGLVLNGRFGVNGGVVACCTATSTYATAGATLAYYVYKF